MKEAPLAITCDTLSGRIIFFKEVSRLKKRKKKKNILLLGLIYQAWSKNKFIFVKDMRTNSTRDEFISGLKVKVIKSLMNSLREIRKNLKLLTDEFKILFKDRLEYIFLESELYVCLSQGACPWQTL